jgi:hypothetical protein
METLIHWGQVLLTLRGTELLFLVSFAQNKDCFLLFLFWSCSDVRVLRSWSHAQGKARKDRQRGKGGGWCNSRGAVIMWEARRIQRKKRRGTLVLQTESETSSLCKNKWRRTCLITCCIEHQFPSQSMHTHSEYRTAKIKHTQYSAWLFTVGGPEI